MVPPADPFDVEIHEMELCGVLSAQEDGDGGKGKKNLSEVLMDESHPEEEDEEEEEKAAKARDAPAEDAGTQKLDVNP